MAPRGDRSGERGQLRPSDTFVLALVSGTIFVGLMLGFRWKIPFVVTVGGAMLLALAWGMYIEHRVRTRSRRRKRV